MNTTNTPGLSTGRFMRALGVAEDRKAAVAYAESQSWVEKSAIVDVIKAGVSGLTTSDLPANAVVSDFLAAIRPYSILSRMDRIRKVPSRTRVTAFGSGTRAYVVGERKPIPMSAAALVGLTVEPVKIAALSVVTSEFLQSQGSGVEEALADDLASAVGQAEDATFFLPTTTGSILDGAPTAVSAGATLANVDADLQKAMDLLTAAGGKLADAMWILSPEAAGKLAGMRGTSGAPAFPDIGPNGGELLKLPAITSEAADGYLALIDQRGVMINSDATTVITLSNETTIQMSDTPTSPPDGPVQLVGMFQTHSIAYKGVLYRGWTARAGAGAYISGGGW